MQLLLKSWALLLCMLAVFVFCNRKKYICAGYSTYFIHDAKVVQKTFSPFFKDSLGLENEEKQQHTLAETEGPYKIKLENEAVKRHQTTGLIVNNTGKTKLRNQKEIEMRFIKAKPEARFMNTVPGLLTPKPETSND